MSRKKDTGFNNPFAAAKAQLANVLPPPPPTVKGKKQATPPPPPPPVVDEAQLFADEMMGVARIEADHRGRVGAPPVTPPAISRHAADEAEAYASLADLIDGQGHFDFADTDEYLEGIAPGLDRRLLRRLRKGDFALQGHIDLHGMTRDEAHLAVDKFITSSHAAGKRCLLIIHGRGLHSKDQMPVLKERMKAWLERGRISRSVLAFTSARPCDGGAGAIYVLLRK